VYENARIKSGLNLESIQWAFTATTAGHWHPVTWLSHLADAQLYAMNPGGHPCTSVVIPVAASIVLFLFFSLLAVIRYRKSFPYMLVGWFLFLVTLVPVIGLVQVGVQAMADRFNYIPMVGVLLMAAGGMKDLAARVTPPRPVLGLLATSLYYSGDVDGTIRELELELQRNPEDGQVRDLLHTWSQQVSQ